jgi:hypothetical protein
LDDQLSDLVEFADVDEHVIHALKD